MSPLTEHEILIHRAVALMHRSAWHAKQSADLANAAEELLAEAVTLPHERYSSAEGPRTATRSGVAVPLTRRVLVVDDDQFVRETFAITLRLEGYDVATVGTAEAAVHAAAVRQPDLIFLDLHLPDFDGISFLREFRSVAAHRRTPVAVITGDCFLTDGVTRDLIALGAQLRFKPVWTEDLLALTHSLLSPGSN
jgi:CheY-like chemotaxis protein